MKRYVLEQQKAEQQDKKESHEKQLGTALFHALDGDVMFLKVTCSDLFEEDEIWLVRDDEVLVATVLAPPNSKGLMSVSLAGARPESPAAQQTNWKLMKGDKWPTYAIQLAAIRMLAENRSCMSAELQEVLASKDAEIERHAKRPPAVAGWKIPRPSEVENLAQGYGLNPSQMDAFKYIVGRSFSIVQVRAFFVSLFSFSL